MEQIDQLNIELLEDMTDGFSEERILGEGSYGRVYRGKHKNGQEVAVKKLRYVGPGLDDEYFKNEFANLKELNHPHIIKLIGYCYETKYRYMELNGRKSFGEQTYRALCLEYLHNGSLQNFLSEGICDGRLDWHTCFKIIKGAWEGLKYLHEEFNEPIYHLDLKPGNILLDINMVPKLADFGLSEIFGAQRTRITESRKGTFGYMPPEYIEKGVISKMFDIYSMGVVMIEIIAGLKGRSRSDEMSAQEFINLVHDSWTVKLQEKWRGSSLEAYCRQVKRCMEIALKCMEVDRKKRPNIVDIVDELSELETVADEISRCPGGELLSVYPFQLVFTGDRESPIPCPLHLTNNTDDNIQFRLLIPRQVRANRNVSIRIVCPGLIGRLYSSVPPRTTHTCFLTKENACANITENGYVTLEFWRQGHEDEVHRLKLVARCEGENEILLDKGLKSMDVHPTKPWIVVVGNYYMHIHNYEARIIDWRKNFSIRFPGPTLAKFIARKKWIVAGDSAGGILVYSYEPDDDDRKEIIHNLKQAHSNSIVSLAIHPAEPYMLSASKDGSIKLWNFENEWNVMQVFGQVVLPWQELHVHRHLAFNPKDASVFVSVQDNRIKIWNLHRSECTWSMDETSGQVPLSMNCLNYLSQGNKVFLIGGFSEGIIKVWDFKSMKCVKTLGTPYGDVRAACAHPNLPVLITGSDDGTICLWNSTNFRLERTLNFGLGSVRAVGCPKDSRRILIGHNDGTASTEIYRIA